MNTATQTTSTCSRCGASSTGRTQFATGFTENYACGSVSHSDGFEQSARCAADQVTRAAQVASHPAVLVADAQEPKALERGIASIDGSSIEDRVSVWRRQTEDAARAAVAAVEGVTIAGHAKGPAKGRKACDDARLALKRVRTPIEARRKELKAPITALGKLVDDEAKRLTEIVLPREQELEAEIQAYDDDQARIQRDAEEAERKRVQDRLDSWIAAEGDPAQIPNLGGMDEEVYQMLLGNAREAKRERDEIRDRKLSEEKAERERQEQEVRDRIAAAEKKLEEEREALARERADLEATRKLLKDQQDRLDAEARAEQKRKDDQAKAEADAKAELERLEREDQERREAEARREAQRPDREKIVAWCEASANAFQANPLPKIDDAGLRLAVQDCCLDILNRLNTLATETQENA